MPSSDQVGTPSGFDGLRHLISSTTSGTASFVNSRILESVSPRQSPRSSIFASMSSDSDSVAMAGLFQSPADRATGVRPPCEHRPGDAGTDAAGTDGAELAAADRAAPGLRGRSPRDRR